VSGWGGPDWPQLALVDATQRVTVSLVIPGPFEAGQRTELAPAAGSGEALARLIAVIGAEIGAPSSGCSPSPTAAA